MKNVPDHIKLNAKTKKFKRPNIAQNRTILNSLWKRELSKFSSCKLVTSKQHNQNVIVLSVGHVMLLPKVLKTKKLTDVRWANRKKRQY